MLKAERKTATFAYLVPFCGQKTINCKDAHRVENGDGKLRLSYLFFFFIVCLNF